MLAINRFGKIVKNEKYINGIDENFLIDNKINLILDLVYIHKAQNILDPHIKLECCITHYHFL